MSQSHDSATTKLREQLASFLSWRDAHADLDAALDGLPVAMRGKRPEGMPHSPWELLEHLRLAQRDILDFCRDPNYVEPTWPDDYWPRDPAPPNDGAWHKSIEHWRDDRDAMAALARDESIDLFAKIPHGHGQTYIREILLVADHNAYHVAQIIDARRLLGAWTAS